jgi:hypothetical protein
MLDDKGAHTQLGRVIETNGRVYIEVKHFINGKPNSIIVGK